MPILDQFGRPIAGPQKKPERRQISVAPVLDSYREYVAAGLTPARLATIFRSADAGDVQQQASLFEQIEERDGHLTGEIGKRKNAILDIEFAVRPASDDARDVKVAEFVEEFFAGQTDWEDVLTALQDGVGKGYSGLEINWDVSEGQAIPDSFEFIPQQRFRFVGPEGYLRKTPLLLTDDDTMGEEIPPWKVMLHQYGGKCGHPTRSGIHRVCAWWFLFKHYSVKDWLIFCEVFGMPLRVGKYDPGASKEDKDALYAAVSALGADAAGIISKSTEIEFIKTEAKGTADLYEALAKFGNAEISKAVLGQTLTAEVGDTGSYAASQTHNEVRLDLAKADTRAVASTTRYQVISPIVGFNFGWDTAVPGYEAVWEEEEDLVAKATWITDLLDRHVVMPVSFVRQEFNIPEPEDGEPTVGAAPAPGPAIAKIVAKAAATAAVTARITRGDADALAQAAAEGAQGEMDAIVARVLEAVEGAQSFEEMGEALYALYPEMDTQGFQEVLARAMFAAGLTGHAAAEGEEDV